MSEYIEHFETILSEDLGPYNEVCVDKIDDLTGTGENYLSHVYKVDVSVKNSANNNPKMSQLHLVVKVVKKDINEVFLVFVKQVFSKEIAFYFEILPTLQKFQFEIGSGTRLNSFAKCLAYRKNKTKNIGIVDENALLIFENLKYEGYSNIDRTVGFDLEGAKLILKDLARFHALTMALKLKKPDVYQSKIREHCQPPHFPESIILRKICSKRWFDAVLNQEKCKPYQGQLKNRLDMELDNMNFVVYRPVNEPYATLMHNDMWTNNTMQVIENGKLVKNKFIDFQGYLYASPFCDMIFFIWCSVQITVVEKHYEELVKHYHHHFFSVLQNFGCDTVPFEYEKVLQQIEKDAPHELIHILYLAAIIYVDKGEASIDLSRDVHEFMSENIGKAAAKRIEYAVSEFGKRGWINLK